MPADQLILLAMIVASTTLYITNWLPTEVTALLTVVLLAATGILNPSQAISGFASTATVTVAAMYVLSAGLMRTGALEALTLQLGRHARNSAARLLFLLALVETPASAFMNNTPVVVMMVPVVVSLSRQFRLPSSKFLLPVSYFAILGGTMSLLGTSTNILVDDLYRKAGGPGFGLFSMAPLGAIYAFVGVTFMIFVGRHLLPSRSPLANLLSDRQHATYITEIVVSPESKLIDRRPAEMFDRIALADRVPPPQLSRRHRRLGAPHHAASSPEEQSAPGSVQLLEVIRAERVFQGDELAGIHLAEYDVLLVAGTPKDILLFQQDNHAALATVVSDDIRSPVERLEERVVEAVVMPGSNIVGRRIGRLMLNRRFGVRVMGVQHQGRQQVEGLRSLRLENGDVLLLRGHTAGLQTAADTCRLLLVEGIESSLVRKTKNRTALIIMATVVILASFTQIPIVVLALAGAGMMILTKCLRVDEATSSLEPSTLLLLAATIPVGLAMESTGLVNTLVDGFIGAVGTSNLQLFLAAFYVITALLTEILSNNAVAVLLTPVALSLAATLGIEPTPLLMAVMFGASAAFMTPFGYQTNAIVMGPGGYKFRDYLRVGIPMQLIMIVVATTFIPLFWPFQPR